MAVDKSELSDYLVSLAESLDVDTDTTGCVNPNLTLAARIQLKISDLEEKAKAMGTKNNPGKFDCYENALPDEPMFILLARDKHAPELVDRWAMLRENELESPAKVAEARECATAMIRWRRENWPPKPQLPKEITKEGLKSFFEDFLGGTIGEASAEVLADLFLTALYEQKDLHGKLDGPGSVYKHGLQDKILQRSDCCNCGAEAEYSLSGIEKLPYTVDCVNIDCPYSKPTDITEDEAANSYANPAGLAGFKP